MNNNDCEFVYSIERKIREDEEAFIYTIIEPFSETVVEKKLSKAELKQILEKGMQKSIPLDKVKQARKDIENEIKFWNEPIKHDVKPVVNMRKAKANSYKHCLEMIDKLITESEE